VLSSGYGRAFRPLHVYGQNARSRGHQDRTQYQTEHSEEADAANHADENHQAAELVRPPRSSGRKTLSTMVDTPRKSREAEWPVPNAPRSQP